VEGDVGLDEGDVDAAAVDAALLRLMNQVLRRGGAPGGYRGRALAQASCGSGHGRWPIAWSFPCASLAPGH
jgi:hypothetical protein